MATGMNISIKDPAQAKQWQAEVRALNERYHVAMESASNTVKSVQEFGEGTYVDELVNFADNFLNAANTVFTAIDAISDTVNSVLGFAGDFLSEAGSTIAGFVGKIFG